MNFNQKNSLYIGTCHKNLHVPLGFSLVSTLSIANEIISFLFAIPDIRLLIRPISLLAGLISLQVGLLLKLSLWSFNEMKACLLLSVLFCLECGARLLCSGTARIFYWGGKHFGRKFFLDHTLYFGYKCAPFIGWH